MTDHCLRSRDYVNVVSGLVPPDAGSIRLSGEEIAGWAPDGKVFWSEIGPPAMCAGAPVLTHPEGAGGLRTFFEVVFPIIWPGVLSAALFGFTTSVWVALVFLAVAGAADFISAAGQQCLGEPDAAGVEFADGAVRSAAESIAPFTMRLVRSTDVLAGLSGADATPPAPPA